MSETTAMDAEMKRLDEFHHRRSLLLQIVGLVALLLGLVVVAIVFGRGLEPADYLLGAFFVFFLLALIAVAAWVLRRNPVALRVSAEGIDLPFAFSTALKWRDVHRIRRETGTGVLFSQRDWLVIEPSPGTLAPIRLRTWRKLDLWFQRNHGVRIALHGLEDDPERVVASVERFRPVLSEKS